MSSMRLKLALALVLAAVTTFGAQIRTPKALEIYFVDTEGGQSTLFVSPTGENALIDAGNPGGRDTDRIMLALADAGVKQIDHMVITHYHGDHIGGLEALAGRIPIKRFYDHGDNVDAREQAPGFQAWYRAYYPAKSIPHVVVKPGDRIPVSGLDWQIVDAAGVPLKTNMAGAPGAGRPNPLCATFMPKDINNDENGQSTGSVIAYGKFRMVDLGDLLWNNEFDLMCPTNRIGTVDVYLTSHHGLDWSGAPVLVHAFQPRVAIMNNGPRKGGYKATFKTLQTSPGLEDIWQLHWAEYGGLEHNAAGLFIANFGPAERTAAMITDPPRDPGPPRGNAPRPATQTPPVGAAAPQGAFGQSSSPNTAAAAGSAPNRGMGPFGVDPALAAHVPAYWIKISVLPDGSFTVLNSRNGFSKTYRARSS
jgi:beta-lactamase superfamily II metal-dependent hydrolase